MHLGKKVPQRRKKAKSFFTAKDLRHLGPFGKKVLGGFWHRA